MNALLDLASIFALDIVADGKPKCVFADFTYLTRVQIAAFAPLIIAGVLMLGGMLWAARHHSRRKAKKITDTRSTVAMAQMRGSHDSIVKSGLWKVAVYILFIVDLIFPTITRVLLQYHTCRDLGGAGWWLEADYRYVLFSESVFSHSLTVC